MEPPDPSFADEFNVPQEDAVLVFNVRRAAVSLPFQTHRLKVLVEAGLVAFSSASPAYCLPPGQILRTCVRTGSWLSVWLCRYCIVLYFSCPLLVEVCY